jgi:hypothetical protein
MEGFALILGHLLGDYVCQRDWEARLKTVSRPAEPRPGLPADVSFLSSTEIKEMAEQQVKWDRRWADYRKAPWACTVHCFQYTLGVYLTSFWFLPWWAYLIIFLTHWPVDRYRWARKFMRWNGQEEFATGVFFPWSIILVDQCMHLAVLFCLGLWWHAYLR